MNNKLLQSWPIRGLSLLAAAAVVLVVVLTGSGSFSAVQPTVRATLAVSAQAVIIFVNLFISTPGLQGINYRRKICRRNRSVDKIVYKSVLLCLPDLSCKIGIRFFINKENHLTFGAFPFHLVAE